MNSRDISNFRLINQQIAESKFSKIKDVVGWMGAMQAQDYEMAKLAIGLRLPGTCNTTIENAIEEADIIRTHLLRPTWHFVSSDDIYWMLELSAPQIKSVTKSRDKELGITETVFSKSNLLLEKILSGGRRLIRSEIVEEFKRENIATDENRFYHLLMRAEIDGIIFSRNSGRINKRILFSEKSFPNEKYTHAMKHWQILRTDILRVMVRLQFMIFRGGPAYL